MSFMTSSQYKNWIFVPSELTSLREACNTAARQQFIKTRGSGAASVCLTADEELVMVRMFQEVMRLFLDRFKPEPPSEVYGIAACYFKRFYLRHSVVDFPPRDIMLTCVYLACKAADFAVSLSTFASYIPRNHERYTNFIVNSELFLLEAINFDLYVHTPYRALAGLAIDLVAYLERQGTGSGAGGDAAGPQLVSVLYDQGRALVNRWYQSDLCFLTAPSQFALAALFEVGRQRQLSNTTLMRFAKEHLCAGQEEEMWAKLAAKLAEIDTHVRYFPFITSLDCLGNMEDRLTSCRNQLYNPESEQYQAVKQEFDEKMSSWND